MAVSRSDFFGSKTKFLKAEHVKPYQKATIERFEVIPTATGDRPSLYFKGIDLPLPLNATNFDFVIENFGDDEEKWTGKQVKFVIVQAPNPQNSGKPTPSIRLSK